MKRGLTLAAAGLIAGTFAFSPVGFAQTASSPPPQVNIVSGGASTRNLPMKEYQAFDQFKSDHPSVVHELSRNPHLLRSRSFQAKHPALRELFNDHPGLQTAMEQNPGNFMPMAEAHRHISHHRQHMTEHRTAEHSETSSTSNASGGGGNAANAPAAPNGNSPAGVNAAPSNGGGANGATGTGAAGGNGMGGGGTGGGTTNNGSANPSGNM